jgi:hypothetical protein
MPWWGWLIAGCVLLICTTWATVALVSLRTARDLWRDTDINPPHTSRRWVEGEWKEFQSPKRLRRP